MNTRLSEGLTVFGLIILINLAVHFLLQGPEPRHFQIPLDTPATVATPHTQDTTAPVAPLIQIPVSSPDQSIKWLFRAFPSN